MPYLKTEEKEALDRNILRATNPGALNYLFTLVLIDAFKGHMKYETLHVLKRDFVIEPKRNKFLQEVRSRLADRFTVGDIYTAASMAWDEFDKRVVSAYERKKIEINGDVAQYTEILKVINAMEAEIKEQVDNVTP